MTNPKNILIVRTDRIGDVILSLPLARIIKNKYPDCRISFLVREYTASIVSDHPYIDEVITLKEKNKSIHLYSNITVLKNKNIDTAIIVYPTFKSALMVFLSGIKFRIGSGYRWYSFLFNLKIFEHRKTAEKHELEYNINLLKKIDINEEPKEVDIKFDLPVNYSNIDKVKTLLNEAGVHFENPVVIIHPGSGGSAVDLSVEKMAEIVKRLSAQENLDIVVTGSKTEFKLCSSIVTGTNAINFAGNFSLKELITLISLAGLFISNSTGPIHIAAALGIPVIGFYPKILSCSEHRWGPYTTKKVVFSPEIDCQNCTREQCERLDCMNSIDINKVIKEVNHQIFRNTLDRK